jgi:hypothetical protein
MELDLSGNALPEETVDYNGAVRTHLRFRLNGGLMLPSLFNRCKNSPYPEHDRRNEEPRFFVILRDHGKLRLIPEQVWNQIYETLSDEGKAEVAGSIEIVNLGQFGEFRPSNASLTEMFGEQFGQKQGEAQYSAIGDGSSIILVEESVVQAPEGISSGNNTEAPESPSDYSKMLSFWLLELLEKGDADGAHRLVDFVAERLAEKIADQS